MALSPGRFAKVDAELRYMYEYLSNLAGEVLATRGVESSIGHAHSATTAAAWAIMSLRQALVMDQELARQARPILYEWVGGQQDNQSESE